MRRVPLSIAPPTPNGRWAPSLPPRMAARTPPTIAGDDSGWPRADRLTRSPALWCNIAHAPPPQPKAPPPLARRALPGAQAKEMPERPRPIPRLEAPGWMRGLCPRKVGARARRRLPHIALARRPGARDDQADGDAHRQGPGLGHPQASTRPGTREAQAAWTAQAAADIAGQ